MVVREWFVMLLLIVLSFVTACKGDGSWSFVSSKVEFRQNKPEDIRQSVDKIICNHHDENETFSGLKNHLQEMEERSLAREETLHNKLDGILNRLIALQSNTSGIMPESKTPEHFSSCLKEPTKQSGTYLIDLGQNKQPLKVNCEQNTAGGGWIVFQYRNNGEENFFRNWSDYRDGFGDLNGEYWLGLENIHQITAVRPHELMVEIKDFHGNYGYAHYDEFEIGNESEGYNLKKLGEFQGSAGDAMDSNRGQKFSTADRPNGASNCAVEKEGGWWYNNCSYANINGPYMNVTNVWGSMSWFNFQNDYRGLSYSRMMMRELNGDE